jgi:RNA polymerase-interacting CarD/CdnL/TRCF family regulator
MINQPLRVRIDRLMLRNVNESRIVDLSALVTELLRRHSEPDTGADRPIPRSGRAMTEAAAGRIAREVRKRINK